MMTSPDLPTTTSQFNYASADLTTVQMDYSDMGALGGGECVMMGGGSAFADGEAAFILQALPAFLRIDRASPGAGAD